MENTVKMSDIESIRDSIISAKSHIENSKNLEWHQIQEIQAREYVSRLPHEMALTSLIDAHFEDALKCVNVPKHHWGADMHPHDISVNEDGIKFTWDINGDYAPVTMLVTWEEILEK